MNCVACDEMQSSLDKLKVDQSSDHRTCACWGYSRSDDVWSIKKMTVTKPETAAGVIIHDQLWTTLPDLKGMGNQSIIQKTNMSIDNT